MANLSISKGGGVGTTFGCLLQISFIVLKLCKITDWNWWWVISPLWISVAIVILLLIIFLGIPALFLKK